MNDLSGDSLSFEAAVKRTAFARRWRGSWLCASLLCSAVGLTGGCGSTVKDRVDASMVSPDAMSTKQRDAAVIDAALPDAEARPEQDAAGPTGPAKPCVVMLHGKSGNGFTPQQRDGYLLVGPTGNAEGWGGRQWIYFPDSEFQSVQQIVAAAITDNACTRVVIHGFSNGGAAAAKLFCRGNTFGGRVVGYVIDDPVPDHGADAVWC